MSQPRDARLYRTTIEYAQSGDAWKAWEPNADNENYGRGQTPAEAVMNYCEFVMGDADGV